MSTAQKAPKPIPAPDFELGLTLNSGQAFHWVSSKEGGYIGMIGTVPIRIEQKGKALVVDCPGNTELIQHYFALDHPMPEIYASFPPGDLALQEALGVCRGMRILRQPKWECLATFITSSMKQVAHIAQMSHSIRGKFGTPVQLADALLYAYPSPEQLAAGCEEDLRECKLGYRAKICWELHG